MKKYLSFLLISIILGACGNNTEQVETEDNLTEVDTLTPERAKRAQLIFQTVPSPFETASIFQSTGTAYNSAILNPIENVNNYSTNHKKAINFGVYGADLSYANIFDQTQESMFYMNCSKKLADGLGITAAFDAATMERLEENMNNRDSLMIIINDVFWITDAFLKENGQDNLSALIILGGWIEGLYISTQSMDKENPNDLLMEKIAEQKYSLDNLMALIASYDNLGVEQIEQKMKSLQLAFNKIEEKETETTVSSDGGVPTIGGGSTLTYEAGTIIEIRNIAEEIRTDIIQ